jgi:hypothetical protein
VSAVVSQAPYYIVLGSCSLHAVDELAFISVTPVICSFSEREDIPWWAG